MNNGFYNYWHSHMPSMPVFWYRKPAVAASPAVWDANSLYSRSQANMVPGVYPSYAVNGEYMPAAYTEPIKPYRHKHV